MLKERLKLEYGVNCELEPLRFSQARWIGGTPEGLKWLEGRRDYTVVEDRNEQHVVLAETAWMMQYARDHAPGLVLYDVEPL